MARVKLPGGDRLHDGRFTCHHHPVTDGKVIRHPHLARQRYKITDRRRPGDPHLAGKQAAAADLHVVGDVHQVVDFSAVTNDRIADSTPVNGAVGTDLHLVPDNHPAHLGNFVVDIFFGDIAIAVGADNSTAVDDDLITQAHAFVDDHVRVQMHPTADNGAPTHTDAGSDNRPIADGNLIADHCTGPDAHLPAQLNLPPQSG